MSRMKKAAIYALFIVAVVLAGFLTGISNRPGPWFDALDKPFFQPPNWLFGPVWTVLYVMIAVVGARVWLAAPKSARMGLWAAQMLLNLLWSPAFFGLQNPELALAVVLPLLAVNVAFIAVSWKTDRVSALLFVPYVLWTGFASLLNGAIVYLN